MPTTKNPARLSDIAVRRGELVWLDPRIIQVIPDFNIRDLSDKHNQDTLEELAADIAKYGVKTPMKVFYEKGIAYLIGGHRRLEATLAAIRAGADIQEVPCFPEPKGTTEEERIGSLLRDNNYSLPTLLEQTIPVLRLLEKGYSEEKIAELVGKSEGHVSNLLKLGRAPTRLKEHIREGRLSATQAIDLLRDFGEKATEQAEAMIAEAGFEGKTKATKKHLKAATGTKSSGGMIYSRTVQNSMVEVLQELLVRLVPATQYRSERTMIRAVLENAGAPLKAEEDE